MTLTRYLFSFGLLAGCGLAACGDDGEAGMPFSGVKGNARDVHRTEAGETVVAPEATRWSSIAAIPLAGAQPGVAYPGTLSAGGDILIADVPEGPYLLELVGQPPVSAPDQPPGRSYFELSERTFGVDRLFSHRPDVQEMTRPAYLTLNAALSRPWQSDAIDEQGEPLLHLDDGLFLYSRNAFIAGLANARVLIPETPPARGMPANGDSALAWTIDARTAFSAYFGAGSAHLPDAAKGDDFTVLHDVAKPVRTPGPPPAGGGVDPWQAYVYTSVEGALRADPFTIDQGGTATLEGAFEAVPPKAFAFDYRGSAFNELMRDAPAGGQGASVSVSLAIYHEPVAPEPADGAIANLLSLRVRDTETYADPVCNPLSDLCEDVTACPAGCGDERVQVLPGDHAREYTYGNPFEGGLELASVVHLFAVSTSAGLPEGETPEQLVGRFSITAPVAELNGQPVAPTLSLPRNITVNGQPAPLTGVSAGVGLTPTIAFEPPSVGAPAFYTIRVIEINDRKDAEGRIIQRNRRPAFFQLTSTSLALPAGVLQAGKHYALEVAANADNNAGGSFFRFGPRSTSATTFTGIFTP
jgi:hypothetical protein